MSRSTHERQNETLDHGDDLREGVAHRWFVWPTPYRYSTAPEYQPIVLYNSTAWWEDQACVGYRHASLTFDHSIDHLARECMRKNT